MKYKLNLADSTGEGAKKYEKLGFKIETEATGFCKAIGHPEIEIKSIEELDKFIEEFGDIVISEGEITIYNGYIE